MKMTRVLLGAGLLLFFAAGLNAQGRLPVPDVILSVSPGSQNSGEPAAWVEALYTVPKGLHQILQKGYFGIVFSADGLSDGWRAGPVVYPPTEKKIAGIGSYEGSVLIRVPLYAPAGGEKLKVIKGKVLWQLCYDDGVCLVPSSKAFTLEISEKGTLGYHGGPLSLVEVKKPSPGGEPAGMDMGSLVMILLFAFLGGIILNLMPCVLPVISIKVMSLIKQSEADSKARWYHAWASMGGILSSLMVLALGLVILKLSGFSVGWGIQFQNPWYVLGLLVLVIVFALSLFDVFIIPAPGVKTGRHQGLAGSFFTGFLTVVLATPCTAPFLGTALGFAFSAPWWAIILVFLFIGLGLALPYFLISIIPGALRWLPKPGRWMDILRALMGFALVGTGIWLLTVLGRQTSVSGFEGVLWFLGAVTLGAWVLGMVQRSSLGQGKRRFLVIALAIGLGLSAFLLGPLTEGRPAASDSQNAELPQGWGVFSEEKVKQSLDSGLSVFVDFTAQWCLTCKINEAGPLSDPKVLEAFSNHKVVLLRGDFTNADPVISAWLTRYSRAGVPFYALLYPGKEAKIFPEILSSEMLISGL